MSPRQTKDPVVRLIVPLGHRLLAADRVEKEIALAFFVPVILYMNNAVGTQTQTIFVRRSAFDKVNLKKYLFLEFKTAVVIGTVISILTTVFEKIWFKEGGIGLIVGFSMFLGILTSIFIGILIPSFLEKIGKDPAIGSGPFATIIQDVASILIYFSIASALL